MTTTIFTHTVTTETDAGDDLRFTTDTYLEASPLQLVAIIAGLEDRIAQLRAELAPSMTAGRINRLLEVAREDHARTTRVVDAPERGPNPPSNRTQEE